MAEIEQSSAGSLCDVVRAAAFRMTVGVPGSGERAAVLEHYAQIERGRGIAALVGASVGGLGLGQRPPGAKELTEIERTRGIAAFVRAAIRRFGLFLGASLLEQHPKI